MNGDGWMRWRIDWEKIGEDWRKIGGILGEYWEKIRILGDSYRNRICEVRHVQDFIKFDNWKVVRINGDCRSATVRYSGVGRFGIPVTGTDCVGTPGRPSGSRRRLIRQGTCVTKHANNRVIMAIKLEDSLFSAPQTLSAFRLGSSVKRWMKPTNRLSFIIFEGALNFDDIHVGDIIQSHECKTSA